VNQVHDAGIPLSTLWSTEVDFPDDMERRDGLRPGDNDDDEDKLTQSISTTRKLSFDPQTKL